MPTFGKKNSYADWLYSRPVIAFLGILVIFMSVAVFKRFNVERDMHERRVTAEAELQAALRRQGAIKEEVEYLEGERGIEEEIREHFDVAREGETVVILMGDEGETTTEAVIPVESAPKWYEFWR